MRSTTTAILGALYCFLLAGPPISTLALRSSIRALSRGGRPPPLAGCHRQKVTAAPKFPRGRHCEHRHRHRHCHCHPRTHLPILQPLSISTATALYLSENALPDSNDSNENNPPKSPKQWLQSRLVALKRAFAFLLRSPSKFRSYCSQLTRRGKIVLSVQLLALGMILGVGYKSSMDAQARRAKGPVEVGYSTFLDLVDVNGKGHAPGKNPALKLTNVVLSKDRIHFRIETDAEKHAKAVLDKKLVQSNDVSIRPIAPYGERTIYARVPAASQTLMETLRENGVPFRAASTKGQTAVGNAVRFSIVVVYMLFLRRLYKTMGGGGGGGGLGSGAPGKLATFHSDEPLVKFEDIEGIDDAKFEVMELVDTLRNPKKYEILGARAPTGLLLEGPPGTGG